MNKKIYGIGTGPGDSDYLTLKAVKAMEEASVIFGPNNNGKNMAIDTAEEFIKDKKLVLIDFPMGEVTREDYKRAAEIIEREIPEGESGAFLTIGDPMIYSTFIYIIEELEKKFTNMEIEVVSGIPSFVAAAGESQSPLTVKDDDFVLCDELTPEKLQLVDSIAILKTFKNKEKTIEMLEEADFNYTYIKRATLEMQEILTEKEEILEDKDYISLILGRRNN